MKQQSQRQLRVGQQIRAEIAQQFSHGGFTAPELQDAHTITVTEVSMSPDLKNARAYVVHLGDESMSKDLLKALNEIAPHLQGKISRALNLRNTPRLRFEEDTSFNNAQRMNTLFASIKEN